MVDLAGSERVDQTGASGERLREAKNINKSLATLCDVVKALSAQDKAQHHEQGRRSSAASPASHVLFHVPYRNSVLTWLLKESLGGNARTTMLAAVSPAANAYDETISTLKYAERAKRMRTRAVVNARVSDEHLIAALRGEVAALRAELNARKSSDAASSSAGGPGGGGASGGATRRMTGGSGYDGNHVGAGPHKQGFNNGYQPTGSSGGVRTSGGHGFNDSGSGNGGSGSYTGARSNSRVASKKQRKAARRRPHHHSLNGERAPPPGGGVLSPVNEEGEEIDDDDDEEGEYATEEDLDGDEEEEDGLVLVSELASHDSSKRRFSAPQRLQNQHQNQLQRQEDKLTSLSGSSGGDGTTASSTVRIGILDEAEILAELERGLCLESLVCWQSFSRGLFYCTLI